MSKPVVLIESATSRNGNQVAKQLLAQGKHTVRLAARYPAKLPDLVSQGTEAIEEVADDSVIPTAIALDPLSEDSMTQACTGLDYVYLILPTLAKDAEIIMFQNFFQVAHAIGIKHIVYLSSIEVVPTNNAGFKPVHNHYELLNQLNYHSDEIKNIGEFKTNVDDNIYATMRVQDITSMAVVVLNYPSPHIGKIYPLTTNAMSDGTVAAIVSKVTGQKVRHVNLSTEEHTEMAVKKMGDGSEAKEFARGLVTLDFEKRQSLFSKLYPDLEQLLGHTGISLED